MSSDLVNSLIAERYRLDRQIGEGGTATVYLAEDLKHERRVAVKVIKEELTSSVGADRFLREVRITARLQHPHILPIHDSGEYEGRLYYVMPYVEGESLREKLSREGSLSLDEALNIAIEVADGLEYAHGQGFVHRDVKPENILLSAGHAIISDFGIARAIDEARSERLTATGRFVGTPPYMSPEQASGEEDLDGRSDIYSLACVLFEMLTGGPPFTGRTAQALIAHHVSSPAPWILETESDVPFNIAAAIQRALSKSRDERFSTCAEFAHELQPQPQRKSAALARVRSRSHLIVLLVVGTLSIIAGGTFWLAATSSNKALDPNKVVVYPLVQHGPPSTDAEQGWAIAIAIGTALEHTRPLKTIDGWSRLDETMRADPELITADVANGIARDRGARFYIDGFFWSGSDSQNVVLRLSDAQGDSLIAQETEKGATGSGGHPQLGLRALARLLPHIVDAKREIDLSAFSDRDPGAIALWLQGERQYRRSDYASALGFFSRAVAEDSLLVIAALRGAQAASWVAEFQRAKSLIAVATAHDSLVPPHYADLAEGLSGYLTGQADLAVSHLRAALEQDPDWGEAAVALGEVYYHLQPSEAPLDSLAEFWFQRALESDSAFTEPLRHLTEIALRRGQLARAENLIDRARRFELDSALVKRLELMWVCVGDGPSDGRWMAEASEDVDQVFRAAQALAGGARQSDCAEAGFRAVIASTEAPAVYKWGALVSLSGLLVAEGRDDRALLLLDSALASGVGQVYSLYVVNSLASADMGQRAAEAERVAREFAGPTYERAQPQTRWLLGTWQAHIGNAELADKISRQLLDEAAESGSREKRLLGRALAAHAALARGDSAEALERYQELTPSGERIALAWDYGEPLAVERLKLAKLLLARGEFARAFDVASIFDQPDPAVYLPFVPQSLEIRIHAAEHLNRSEAKAELTERLFELGRFDLIDRPRQTARSP